MITQLVNLQLIQPQLQATTKQELFAELAQLLLNANKINNKEAFLADIERREQTSVTSMDGIAYPHAKSSAVIDAAIAVGVKREGIEYGDEDGVKPSVFFMIASPNNDADHHIYVLQELFGKFSEKFVEQIHATQNSQQILNLLTHP
ncbi:MAG: PTS sugar transporter subunit IIA [Vibrionaceae bacterium]